MAAVTDVEDQADKPRTLYWHFNRFLERHLPEGLYPRSLIIVIAPMVLLQSIMAYTIMERHWDKVTRTLSKSVAHEMQLLVDLYQDSPHTPQSIARIEQLANDDLGIGLKIETGTELPTIRDKPFYSILDQKLSRYVGRYVKKPFWLDTLGHSGFVDTRILVEKGVVFRFLTDQARAYASNTYIFLLWMIGSSLVLLAVAIVFLRKQIRPIQELADAAKSFGMGRDVPAGFEPRGAAEVKQAARAFLAMKERIERHVEQRTAMLAGVSHDLRTILTRFRLGLAVLKDQQATAALREDVDEMQRMLEGYMAFVRGDGGEATVVTDISDLASAIGGEIARTGPRLDLDIPKGLMAAVKPIAFKRCLGNLIGNAVRQSDTVRVAATSSDGRLTILIDDAGPGIPRRQREDVFRPFVRLEGGRNQDTAGIGLGLTVARDIARSHGGEIVLEESPLGGLRARVTVPV